MGCRRGGFLDRAVNSSPRNCVSYCVTGLRPRASSVWLRQTTRQEEMPGRDARLSRESHVSGASLEGIASEAKARLKGRPASRSYATERMTRVVRVSLRCKPGFILCLFPLLHGRWARAQVVVQTMIWVRVRPPRRGRPRGPALGVVAFPRRRTRNALSGKL